VRNRYLRLAGTLAVTGLCTAYLIWKIDLSQTLHILAHANVGYFLGAVAIMIGTVWPMAWRWQQLLAVRGIHDRLSWLTRAYFVAYTAGQLLPTAVGGDAVRVAVAMRRRVPAVAGHVDAAAEGHAVVDHDDLVMMGGTDVRRAVEPCVDPPVRHPARQSEDRGSPEQRAQCADVPA